MRLGVGERGGAATVGMERGIRTHDKIELKVPGRFPCDGS